MAFFATQQKTPLGIYVHVPFCRSKCQYCDFYSLTCKDDKLMDQYLDAVCAHIKETGALAPDYLVDTVYFGGGTPTLLGARRLESVLCAARTAFSIPDAFPKRALRSMSFCVYSSPIFDSIRFI